MHGILDLLELPNRPAAVDVVHTRSWEAYARFARGLQLLDRNFAVHGSHSHSGVCMCVR